MTDYSFDVLNDKEFEVLIVDLLSEVLNVRVERFKSGRDQGVDGRFFENEGQEGILQCKHFLGSGYNQLITKLKNDESSKVKKLNPHRYIFATSLPLSRAQKKEIKIIFDPYIKCENDIYGKEDINDLLKKFPTVEENHYKLWLSSTTVFSRLIHNAIKGRSRSIIEETRKKLPLYVQTENHTNALEILNKLHTVIITGEPGIGKSTLAENICYFYCSKEYELCVLQDSIKEAEDVYIEDKKQIFFFDDFLGSNFLLAIENNKDSHIMRFIQRVKNDKSKKFVLTSRTNILNQGLLLSDIFVNKKINKHDFLLSVENLKPMDKALILYNHIWFSFLNEEYIEQIYKDKRYKEIINHKNFNPRIIEYITDNDNVLEYSPQEYWPYIINTLNNPADIWAHAFDIQSDDYIRNLVLLTVFNGNTIDETILRDAYYQLNALMALQGVSTISREFDICIRTTVRMFLNRTIIRTGSIFYTLFNPSIADYVLKKYQYNTQQLAFIFQALKTSKSLEELRSLYENKIISIESFKTILFSVYESAQIELSHDDKSKQRYFVNLITLLKEYRLFDEIDSKKIISYIALIFDKHYIYSVNNEIIETIQYFMAKKLVSINDKQLLFLVHYIDEKLDDINALLIFLITLNKNHYEETTFEEITDTLNKKIEVYLTEALDSEVNDIDLYEYFTGYDPYDGSAEIDEWALESTIENLLDDLIVDLEFFKGIDICKEEILASVDIRAMIDDFNPDIYEEDDDFRRSSGTLTMDSIDELFTRA